MERLTKKNWKNLDPWECCGQDNFCKRGCHEEGGCAKGCIVPRIYARLAAYEDAEEAGLLIRLPCRIDSTVYRVVEKCKPRGMDCPFEGGYGISRCHQSKDRYKFCVAYIEETRFELEMIDEIGKTVFLTREEAEAALAKEG